MDVSTVLQFFDLSKPCPSSIKNGETLRQAFVEEINSISAQCKECERIKIRDKYIKIIRS